MRTYAHTHLRIYVHTSIGTPAPASFFPSVLLYFLPFPLKHTCHYIQRTSSQPRLHARYCIRCNTSMHTTHDALHTTQHSTHYANWEQHTTHNNSAHYALHIVAHDTAHITHCAHTYTRVHITHYTRNTANYYQSNQKVDLCTTIMPALALQLF